MEIERIKKEEIDRYEQLQRLLLKVCLGRKGHVIEEEKKEEEEEGKGGLDSECKIFYTRKDHTLQEVKLEIM